MKRNKYLLLILLLIIVCNISAQIVPPPMGPPPPPGLPVDGGVIFLFITGLIYGVKKIKD